MKAIEKKINKVVPKGTRPVFPLRFPIQFTSETEKVEAVCPESKNSIKINSGESK